MQRSFSLKITDLEFIESGVEQKITLENAEKILGGVRAYPGEPGDDPPAHKKPKKPIKLLLGVLDAYVV